MFTNKYYYIFFTFLLTQAITAFIIFEQTQTRVDKLLQDESKKIQTQYISIFKNFEDLANTIFNGYINDKEILKNFNEKNREALFNDLKEPYKYLKSVNINQLHFHTKDNISFLRMHKPEKFGDDLSDFRYTVNYTNSKKLFISGLEMGRVVPGFRFVYPLLYKDQHIGSVETSFEIKSFAQKLNKMYNVNTKFIIDNKMVSTEVFSSFKKNYIPSIESDHYKTFKPTASKKIQNNHDILKKVYESGLKEEIKNKIAKKKLFSINKKINNHFKIITFLPVEDLERNHIGYFVIYRNSEQLKKLDFELNAFLIFSFIIICGLFIYAYREFKHKDSLKEEVALKTKKLNDTAVKLEEQTYELEELNKTLEEKIAIQVEKNAKQERELFQQSKQAALGDMIGNIAHQWRQPLSAISSSASGMQLTHYSGLLNEKEIISFTDAIIENANYLSRTIDDFRDFIKSDKKITRFDINHAVNKCMDIVNSSINNHSLNIVMNEGEDLIIANYENELQQAIINIFSNAKDVLKDRIGSPYERFIFINTYKENNKVNISIKDTAGGIDESILDKIFEPYFTTKHQAQGTGLGLYMTHKIIVESMNGSIYVENVTFEYKGKEYSGAEFVITLPIK